MPILAIGLGKKIKKNANFSHFWLFKDVIFIILHWFLFFLASLKSGNDFLYSQHGRSTSRSKAVSKRKKCKFWFFVKIFKFSKKLKFSIFLPLTAMCYGHVESIKSHFLTLEKPKKQKTMQNNEYNILEKSKMTKICTFFEFFLFFSPSQ